MTARNVARLLQLVLLLAASESSAQRAGDSAGVCRGGHWLAPHELRTAEGYSLMLERPSVMPLRGNTFITAFPVMAYDSAGKLVWPLAVDRTKPPQKVEEVAIGVLEDSNGVSHLVPSPKDLVVAPFGLEAALDHHGVVHVVWASNDSTPMTSMTVFRSLWYARFDGATWSTPVRILTGPGKLMWIPSNRSAVVLHELSVHLAVSVMGEGIRYLHYRDGVWTDSHVDIPTPHFGYPQLAVLSSGRVVLMVQGPAHSDLTQFMSGFYATWTDDGGKSWAPPVHISNSEDGPTYDAQLVVDVDDVLYASWYQQTDAQGQPALSPNVGTSPGRIYLARSTDGGAHWEQLGASSLFAGASGLLTMLLRDHSVLTAVLAAPNEQLVTQTWLNGWMPPLSIAATPDPFNPSLGLGGAQRPVLTSGIRRKPHWGGTMVTTLVPCR